MKRIMIIISLMGMLFIMLGCGKTATELNLENFRKNHKETMDGINKAIDAGNKAINKYIKGQP